ncbi:hypothetical protein BJ741DRAFT_711145 [Chytriomyces cf. hyalinus JEL632]|nr:hypothetical protein BJ741DRAFT_711145 [Chytriomyces cf. hyalinus JEL632]
MNAQGSGHCTNVVQLPTSVLHVFDYTVVKIATFALVIYFSDHNVGSAILVASALVISIMVLTSRGGKYMEHLDTVPHDHPQPAETQITNQVKKNMPKIVLNSQRNTDSISGITMLHMSWLDQPVLTTSGVKFKSLIVSDLIADGNIALKGTVSEIETQHTLFCNLILDINADNLTPLLMGGLHIQCGPGLAPFNVLYNEDNRSLQIGFANTLIRRHPCFTFGDPNAVYMSLSKFELNVAGDASIVGHVTLESMEVASHLTVSRILDMHESQITSQVPVEFESNQFLVGSDVVIVTVDGISVKNGALTLDSSALQLVGDSYISGVRLPISPNDAANKMYVDSLLTGLMAKAPVQVASSVSINTTNTITTSLVIDTLILIRDHDFAVGNDVSGSSVFAALGQEFASTRFIAIASQPVGAGPIHFTPIAGTCVDAPTYTADNGIMADGFTFKLAYDPISLTVDPSTKKVKVNPNFFGAGMVVGPSRVNVDSTLSHVTGLGAITTGAWRASPVNVPYGGTGCSQFVPRSFIMGNRAGQLQSSNVTFLSDKLGINVSAPETTLHPQSGLLVFSSAQGVALDTDQIRRVFISQSGVVTFYGLTADHYTMVSDGNFQATGVISTSRFTFQGTGSPQLTKDDTGNLVIEGGGLIVSNLLVSVASDSGVSLHSVNSTLPVHLGNEAAICTPSADFAVPRRLVIGSNGILADTSSPVFRFPVQSGNLVVEGGVGTGSIHLSKPVVCAGFQTQVFDDQRIFLHSLASSPRSGRPQLVMSDAMGGENAELVVTMASADQTSYVKFDPNSRCWSVSDDVVTKLTRCNVNTLFIGQVAHESVLNQTGWYYLGDLQIGRTALSWSASGNLRLDCTSTLSFTARLFALDTSVAQVMVFKGATRLLAFVRVFTKDQGPFLMAHSVHSNHPLTLDMDSNTLQSLVSLNLARVTSSQSARLTNVDMTGATNVSGSVHLNPNPGSSVYVAGSITCTSSDTSSMAVLSSGSLTLHGPDASQSNLGNANLMSNTAQQTLTFAQLLIGNNTMSISTDVQVSGLLSTAKEIYSDAVVNVPSIVLRDGLDTSAEISLEHGAIRVSQAHLSNIGDPIEASDAAT